MIPARQPALGGLAIVRHLSGAAHDHVLAYHPLLIRCAFIGLVLVGLMAVADGMVRYELQQAMSEMPSASTVADAQPAGASDE